MVYVFVDFCIFVFTDLFGVCLFVGDMYCTSICVLIIKSPVLQMGLRNSESIATADLGQFYWANLKGETDCRGAASSAANNPLSCTP